MNPRKWNCFLCCSMMADTDLIGIGFYFRSSGRKAAEILGSPSALLYFGSREMQILFTFRISSRWNPVFFFYGAVYRCSVSAFRRCLDSFRINEYLMPLNRRTECCQELFDVYEMELSSRRGKSQLEISEKAYASLLAERRDYLSISSGRRFRVALSEDHLGGTSDATQESMMPRSVFNAPRHPMRVNLPDAGAAPGRAEASRQLQNPL